MSGARWVGAVSSGYASASSGMVTTLRLTETFPTWYAAMCFVGTLGDLPSKPTVRRDLRGWTVRYEPHLIMINGGLSA